MTGARPTLIGVLNLSPESTVPGSVATSPEAIRQRAEALRKEGAAYIEIGARSINPEAPMVDDVCERDRLLPALHRLKEDGFEVAVETWSEATACSAMEQGADLINFSAGRSSDALYRTAARFAVPLVLLYLPYDDPYAMRSTPCVRYGPEAIDENLRIRAGQALAAGCADVIVDPNFGIFHPDVDLREKILYQVRALRALDALRREGLPRLAYCPRKESLTSRLIMAALLLDRGVEYLRIHEPRLIADLLGYE